MKTFSLQYLLWFKRNDYFFLILSILVFLAIPFIDSGFNENPFLQDFIFFSIFLFGNMVLYDHINSSSVKPWMIIGGLAMLTSFSNLLFEINSIVFTYFRLIEVLYFLILTFRLFVGILQKKEVDEYVMVNSITSYLLIGMSWGLITAILSMTFPDSYNMVWNDDASLYDFMYYSFVTMSTLGYGDILPLSAQSRALTIFIVASGIFFTTIVLGSIVGKYIANEQTKEK